MANRRELQERREKLRLWLIESCRSGALKPGAMLPPVRELALEHGVSASSAFEIVRELASEGLLHCQHGAGTFVGRLPTRDDLFLLVLPGEVETAASFLGVRNGFESFLTRLGATCLTLSRKKALAYRAGGQLEGLAGVGEFCSLVDQRSWNGSEPFVMLREMRVGETPGVDEALGDAVYLDNEDAGRQATQHLLNLGHRRIAFLGVHVQEGGFAGSLDWSRQRLNGWQSALRRAGCEVDRVFCPQRVVENSHAGLHEAGCELGRQLVQLLGDGGHVTAVVGSNGFSTEGMFEALSEARVPSERWPAVVSFDDFITSNSHLLSGVRPSWEELGRQGAALLWERRQGRLGDAPQQRAVPMELIPRFSCRPQQLRFSHPAMASSAPVAVRHQVT